MQTQTKDEFALTTEIISTDSDILVTREKVPIFANKGPDFFDYLSELRHVWKAFHKSDDKKELAEFWSGEALVK